MVQRFLAPGGDPSPSAVELRLRALTMQTWGHVLPLGAMGGCSLGVPTWLADDAALAWHAPGCPPRRPYQWCCLSLRARVRSSA